MNLLTELCQTTKESFVEHFDDIKKLKILVNSFKLLAENTEYTKLRKIFALTRDNLVWNNLAVINYGTLVEANALKHSSCKAGFNKENCIEALNTFYQAALQKSKEQAIDQVILENSTNNIVATPNITPELEKIKNPPSILPSVEIRPVEDQNKPIKSNSDKLVNSEIGSNRNQLSILSVEIISVNDKDKSNNSNSSLVKNKKSSMSTSTESSTKKTEEKLDKLLEANVSSQIAINKLTKLLAKNLKGTTESLPSDESSSESAHKKRKVKKSHKKARKSRKKKAKKGKRSYKGCAGNTTTTAEESESEDTSSELSESESEDFGIKYLNKKSLVSRSLKRHPWLVYTNALNSSKILPIQSLNMCEIENFIGKYVKEHRNMQKLTSRVGAYICILYEISSIRMLGRFTQNSIEDVIQLSVNQIDNLLIENKKVADEKVESLFQSNLFKLGMDKQKSYNINSSKSQLNIKAPKKPYIRWCMKWNANKSCNSDCRYEHICKHCWEHKSERQEHQPKECFLSKRE